MPRIPITRRNFLLLAGAAGAVGLGVDTVFVEPNHPHIVRRDMALRRWPERLNGFTIALLSDFHYDTQFSVHPLEAAIGMVNGLRPDMIVLTGDFVSMPLFTNAANERKAASMAEPCARLLGQIQAAHGSWAVLGNHDFFTNPQHVSAALQAEGIQLLANQSVPIERDGARFWLSGVNDVLSGSADLDKTLRGIPAGEATVLLAHEPDYADLVARFPVDFQLSGHSHGGQVRFPLVGPIFLTDLAKKYVWGQYQIRELTLYTNPGLGTVGVPVRWNCPPEITLFTMRRATV